MLVLLELQIPFAVVLEKLEVFPKQKLGKFPVPVIAATVGAAITVIVNGADVAEHPKPFVTVTE